LAWEIAPFAGEELGITVPPEAGRIVSPTP
jgi:hypothetical protein